jgi:tetratricopeptide (TPR) repeat protein
MLDHYLHTGHAAIRWLYPARETVTLIAADPQIAAEDLTGHEQALAWCEAEQEVFPAIIAQAAASGYDTHAWQIPWVLTAYFNRQGYLHDWITTLRTALAAAQRTTDRDGQALASHELGYAYFRLGIYDEAGTHIRCALDLNRQLGDRVRQAHNHLELSRVESYDDHPDKALSHARDSLGLYLASGIRAGQAQARAQEGRCLTQLGEYQQALACALEAIAMYRKPGELGDKYGEAETLRSLGDTYHHLGSHPQAISYYRQALELNRPRPRTPGDRRWPSWTICTTPRPRESAPSSVLEAITFVDELIRIREGTSHSLPADHWQACRQRGPRRTRTTAGRPCSCRSRLRGRVSLRPRCDC